jgi:hypothetical protein
MIRIEQLSVTVSVEGEANAGEAAFARLFEKFSRLREERLQGELERAAAMARDRRIFGGGGR